MDAVKFIKERNRMCDFYEFCHNGCPLNLGVLDEGSCLRWCFEHPEEAVSIVEKWSSEHPVKTRQSEFLKLHPNADIREGILNLCPKRIDLNSVNEDECIDLGCSNCKKKYWFAEVE